MIDFILTLATFTFTVSLIPLLTFSFIALNVFNTLFVKYFSVLNSDLEFIKYKTVRILLDTHRNQGILSILLCVRGGPQRDVVKRYLEELVKRRNKHGEIEFPRLSQSLVTKCGMYAWQSGRFDINQHVVLVPDKYRGRTVSDYNIQDYVSHIVSKYLPIGVPPWQMILIPTSENKHYILLKLHHVLLREGLNVADLLPLIPPTRQPPESTTTTASPLISIFKKPENIPYLKERLAEEFSNKWNEFISNYDPLEKPEIFKTGPGFYEFQAIIIITLASIMREYRRGSSVIRKDPISRVRYAISTAKRECSKRQVNVGNFFKSILVTVDPRNIASFWIKLSWYVSVSLSLKVPMLVYNESMAFINCAVYGYTTYSNTLVGVAYTYIPLFYKAIKEVSSCLKLLFYAPRQLLKEIFFESETIQTMTLCGRKIVAWSQPVRKEFIKTIAKNAGLSETEVVLTATTASISRYLTQSSNELPPSTLPITAINFNSSFIFTSGTNVKPSDSISGVLCLTLPIPKREEHATLLDNLRKVQRNFEEAMEKQSLLSLLSLAEIKYGVLTKLLPQTFLGLLLKYLSRKYPVSFTEITSKYPNVAQCTIWGEEVVSAILWRPPQANISISMCLNEYADHVRLAIMCDAQLGPHHPALAQAFPEHIDRLAIATGTPLESR